MCVFCYNQISVVHAGTSITDASGNAKSYSQYFTTKYQYTPSSDGFVYFGSYPQTAVSRPNGATSADEIDGKVFIDSNGDKYLFEKNYVHNQELVLDSGS
ncbi:MAG: hypothetical protein MJ246_00195 [Clostridia bacterium]|nr:hypothetical protein [Clostridia bacterium]